MKSSQIIKFPQIMKKHILLISIAVAFVSCNLTPNLDMVGMFYGQSPRNDARFEESIKYNEENGVCRTLTLPTDEYKVYFSTDMHVDSTWRNLTKWSQLTQADADCYFAIVLGDVINAQGNYPHFLEGMKPLTKTWFCTAGNHDLYFNQWKDYLQNIGSSTYWFVAHTPSAKDLYICLDSGDGTLGVKQLDWLRSLLKEKSKEEYRHIIVFTHTHMFKRDASQGHTSNFALEETYEITDLLSRYGVEWYVSGHDHHREITDYKGVKYIIVDTLQDPEPGAAFMIATIGTKLQYEFVNINE